MKVEEFVRILDCDFYTGVPDSQLKPLCDYLIERYGTDPAHHIICANEGNCTALAAGYHLATGKTPVVYLQNSGIGNIINPAASLLSDRVYAIPVIFVIGWRGEPGVHDEPQHAFQGEITPALLGVMEIEHCVVDGDTTEKMLRAAMDRFQACLHAGRSVAFVVRKKALSWAGQVHYGNDYAMRREEVIRHIAAAAGEDPVVCTTGKASRELFEIREANGLGHQYDFLTVGSMGHSSSIALGIAVNKPEVRVWCIDGDGAALMHMGAMAALGSVAPKNLIHVIINNGAHETVGGMPTTAPGADLPGVARACGYPRAVSVGNFEELDAELELAKRRGELCLIEVKCAVGARSGLGRPTTTPQENKKRFMEHLSTLK